MQEINGFKVSDSVFEQLSFKKEAPKKGDALERGDFLELMIAQLKNQDPLSPEKGSEFVAQLAQFSTVEGVQDLNTNFQDMSASLKSSQALQASALVGHTVFVDSATARLSSTGEVLGSITVEKPTDDTLLNIYDSRGLLVRQELLGPQDPGEIRFAWDGRTDAGESLPPGVYRFDALGRIDGENVGLKTTLGANVNSVTIGAGGELMLNVDGVGPKQVSDIKEIL
jgi:flagellar basal-body rod modification protein FlgD